MPQPIQQVFEKIRLVGTIWNGCNSNDLGYPPNNLSVRPAKKVLKMIFRFQRWGMYCYILLFLLLICQVFFRSSGTWVLPNRGKHNLHQLSLGKYPLSFWNSWSLKSRVMKTWFGNSCHLQTSQPLWHFDPYKRPVLGIICSLKCGVSSQKDIDIGIHRCRPLLGHNAKLQMNSLPSLGMGDWFVPV